MSDLLRIVVVLLLVLGNAIFVAAEYALVTARRSRLQDLETQGRSGARHALELMDNPVRFISTVQVGITIAGIAMGAIGQPLVQDWFTFVQSDTVAFLIAFFFLTFLSVSLGELVPKAIALQRAERLAISLAWPIDLLGRIAYPLVWLLQTSSNFVVRLFGIQPAPAGVVVQTREDVRAFVAEAGQSGVVEGVEQEVLYAAFKFAEKEAHDVMVHRPEVVAISVNLPPRECLGAVITSPYTRYPAYEESLDQIVGILHVRDLFSALYEKGIDNVVIKDLLRQPYFVPETKDLAALLAEFRQQNQHMAIVVDEYGSMQGIVTLEDLLEEIVGEIEDEYDLPDESLERLDDRRIRVHGTYPIDDFNEQFQVEMPDVDYHTLAGFVFGQLGRAPTPGDEVSWNGLRFKVIEVEGTRIEKLEIEFLAEEEVAAASAESG
ncbi:MAG TPA: hemolysin family protein [Gaiellaceae bacterium]|nr:hemolysin family protein [Gaiellaceae bacterium]HET8653784.1 hemolysin family protein [Gaiellaceae bacterium]